MRVSHWRFMVSPSCCALTRRSPHLPRAIQPKSGLHKARTGSDAASPTAWVRIEACGRPKASSQHRSGSRVEWLTVARVALLGLDYPLGPTPLGGPAPRGGGTFERLTGAFG